MTVPAAHGFGCVADPFVDHSLVDTFARTVADEAVAEAVPAFDDFPLAILERVFKVMGRLIGCERVLFVAFFAV